MARRGVVAAGAQSTAEAAAEVLDRGGNAVDAAVAACFATSAGEPALTSLAAGGFMVHRDALTGEATLLDFFANAPQLSKAALPGAHFYAVDLDFGPTKQQFHIGRAAAAVPGALPGLCSAHARWGRLALREVAAPACRMLREGVVLGPFQAYALKLIRPIVTREAGCRELFAPGGVPLAATDRFRLPALADLLEQLAAGHPGTEYERLVWPAIIDEFGTDRGGLLTRADLRDYRVETRQPLALPYRGFQLLTNGPPSAGGAMIAVMLDVLAGIDLGRLTRGSREHVLRLAQAMLVADEARAAGRDLLFDLPCHRAHFAALGDSLRSAPTVAAPSSTTHVSVLDADGHAAAVTFSHGEGNGHLMPGTGIVMNNLMGEADLFPQGFDQARAGARLSSMMAPTIVLEPDGAIAVLGTGGANRIRTAITQVVSQLCDHGASPEAAVNAPRVHFEAGVLSAEVCDMVGGGSLLDTLGATEIVRFADRSLFFGGVHLVRRRANGDLEGAGDPRRGGACIVV